MGAAGLCLNLSEHADYFPHNCYSQKTRIGLLATNVDLRRPALRKMLGRRTMTLKKTRMFSSSGYVVSSLLNPTQSLFKALGRSQNGSQGSSRLDLRYHDNFSTSRAQFRLFLPDVRRIHRLTYASAYLVSSLVLHKLSGSQPQSACCSQRMCSPYFIIVGSIRHRPPWLLSGAVCCLNAWHAGLLSARVSSYIDTSQIKLANGFSISQAGGGLSW